jgi:hypothetical protein
MLPSRLVQTLREIFSQDGAHAQTKAFMDYGIGVGRFLGFL